MSIQDKPYKNVCCKRCWFAKRKPCKCRCKGQYHQHGLVKKLELVATLEYPFTELTVVDECPKCHSKNIQLSTMDLSYQCLDCGFKWET